MRLSRLTVAAVASAAALLSALPMPALATVDNNQQGVSLYGDKTNPGDTAVKVNAAGGLAIDTGAASGSLPNLVTISNPDGSRPVNVTAAHGLWVDLGAASGSLPAKMYITGPDGSATAAGTGPFVQQGTPAAGGNAWPTFVGGLSYHYTAFATGASISIATSGSTLHAIDVGKGAGVSSVAVYDSTGTATAQIANIDTSATASVGTHIFDAVFSSGITVIASNGSPSITVISK